MYIKAHVRLEGCVNRNWTLTKSDGTEERYYSIEGSPQREGDDERVYDYDPKLAKELDRLSYELVENDDDEVVEFDVDLTNDRVTMVYEPNPTVVMTPTTYRFEGSWTDKSPEEILTHHFKTNRQDVIKFLNQTHPDINLDTYEGGIDDWFGMGSVTLYEIGIEFSFKYSANKIEVTIQ